MENSQVNILLVDDQPGKLLSYEAILSELNENLIKAGSAHEALQQLLKTDIAVVLVDVCMPEMDGFELAEMIRKHPRCDQTSIILVSAVHMSDLDRLRGYGCGAVDYVPVPVVPELLRAKVSIFADLYRKTEQLSRLNAELESRVIDRTAALEESTGRLRENEERYRAFVSNSTEGIGRIEFSPRVDLSLSLDQQVDHFIAHGRIAECNDALARMFGHNDAHELTGVSLSRLFSRENPDHRGFLLRLAESRYHRVEAELLRKMPDGSEICLSGNSVGVIEDNQLLRVWGTLRDITERKRAEHERAGLLESEREARATAEAANRLKDEFLATLSHELRTPINAVLGWVHLMKRGGLDPESMDEGLQVIDRGIRTQVRLIDELLDVNRITAGKFRINEDDVDLTATLDAAIDTIRADVIQRGQHLVRKGECHRLMLRGDATRLQQVFWNILINASKFTPEDGLIEVSLDRHDGSAFITVSDTGQGIDPEVLPFIFERFRQADSSMTRKHGGLGLGLAIAKHIVEMHGGEIRGESEGQSRGCRFTVRLPVIVASSTKPSVDRDDGDLGSADLHGTRILIVDDDEATRDVVARTLREYAATTECAPGADEALRLFSQSRPDILICDIGMPVKDGYALIREIREKDPDVPAVALTAYTRAEDRARALAAGYNIHIPKPINPQELVRVVSELAQRSRSKSFAQPGNCSDTEPSVRAARPPLTPLS